ncbi:MAG: histidine phosphatase family protein [Candidatus Pacebacteria bacterium]|nr:histidine phosphatase family protein [Candidatus Paceibacterota bacterium]
MSKTVYFLRHGQTEGNARSVHQYPETMLSDKGREQVRLAGEHFKDIPLDLIIASPFERTRETASAVLAHKEGVPIEYSALFEELRRPREIWGKGWFSPKPLWIMAMLYMNARKENWHYSDEENLEEFHARARRALEYLADRPEERILVVTHRGLMANLIERIKHDGMDTIAQYRRALWKNLTIGNCCYLTATWTPEGENGSTLDGTWTVQNDTTCPAGGGRTDYRLG